MKVKGRYENGHPYHHGNDMLYSSPTYQLGFRDDLEEDDIEDGAGINALKNPNQAGTQIPLITL